MRVLGTAGHVDHGKSALVQALTGIDPDRLAEEKRRGLTIELGFAWMAEREDGSGERIGFIDVPGHLDFIRAMLAGVSGIDAALLVVAADEGVMPQTREHLDILELLRIPQCIPVLTKVDAVDDEEWMTLVELDLVEVLEATRFRHSPIWRVSAHTGEGMREFSAHLRGLNSTASSRALDAPPRLSVDRVFTRSGFGTVVTGTLVSGTFALGDEVLFLPTEMAGRIRGLQAYHETAERTVAGTRVAVNVSGVPHTAVQRGHTLCAPATFQSTSLVDVKLELLPTSRKSLMHDMEVMVFHGAAETMARVRLMNEEELAPGHQGFCQLVLAEPLVLDQDDRLVLRLPSPSHTMGGGLVLDAHPKRFWKRFTPETAEHFDSLVSDDLAVRIRHYVHAHPLVTEQAIRQNRHFRVDPALDAKLREAVEGGALVRLPVGENHALITAETFREWKEFTETGLRAYHRARPLSQGQLRGEVQAQLGDRLSTRHGVALSSAEFSALLGTWTDQQAIREPGDRIALAGHRVEFSDGQRALLGELEAQMARNPMNPPSLAEIRTLFKGDQALLDALIESGAYVFLGQDVLLTAKGLQAMKEQVMAMLERQPTITMAQVRDQLQTSRKYVQALLEHMDSERLTRRQGNERIRF